MECLSANTKREADSTTRPHALTPDDSGGPSASPILASNNYQEAEADYRKTSLLKLLLYTFFFLLLWPAHS